ncbi:hypothetical protein E2C01_061560 [Portunus trituberculatus]|uniref:Uncharacterized protein n=1 Tax=Portunus trituberculatus TaxID=210409 RepID=A0A5B7HCQ6_PORTR|nr:hypothetical protein [Portunus trituberculatus]
MELTAPGLPHHQHPPPSRSTNLPSEILLQFPDMAASDHNLHDPSPTLITTDFRNLLNTHSLQISTLRV